MMLAGPASAAIVPAKKVHCTNPNADCQRVLVTPVRFPQVLCPNPGPPCDPGLVNNAFCPVADQPCDPNLWIHAPRVSTFALAAELSAENLLYHAWSFGTWQFTIDVLHNPNSADGWWTMPASYQAYYSSLLSGANFWEKGAATRAIVQDAIESIASPASMSGVIAPLPTHSRFVVVDNNHDRYGQARAAVSYSVPFPWSSGFTMKKHLFSGSLVGVASNTADLRSVLAHELGHDARDPQRAIGRVWPAAQSATGAAADQVVAESTAAPPIL